MAHKDYSQSGIGSTVELGKAGAKVKNSSGVVEARNNADDAYAIVRGATPVGDDDLATKAWVEKRYGISVVGQINGGSPPAASVLGQVFLCTTAGGAYTLKYLYRDTGSTWEEIVPVEGMVIGITDALTGGTDVYSADHAYIWDADNTEWDDLGPSVAGTDTKKIEQRTVTVAYTDTGANNVGAVVPAGAKVLEARVNVTQAFDGTTPTLTVGDAVDPDRLLTALENGLTEVVLFTAPVEYTYGSETQITATIAVSGASTGQCLITVLFAHA